MVTTTERALYRAICQNPDDDLPRLAYADLMEEEGDPDRAAFIRTQIALAKVPSYDPLYVSCQRHDPGAINGWGMAHTLPKAPPGCEWSNFRFERGFPSLIRVVSPEAFEDEGLFEAAPIQGLEIAVRGPKVMAALAEWPYLARIRRLEFRESWLSADDVKLLVESPYACELSELSFERGGISPEGLGALAGSKLYRRLTALEIRASGLRSLMLIGSLQQIESVYGSSFQRSAEQGGGSVHATCIKGATTQMQRLSLEEDRVCGWSANVLIDVLFVTLKSVRILSLANMQLGTLRTRSAFDSGIFEAIHSLDLSMNHFGPKSLRLLSNSPSYANLRVLNLSRNPIGDAGARALAESPHLGNLLRLDLRGNTRPFRASTRRLLQERFGDRVVLDESEMQISRCNV